MSLLVYNIEAASPSMIRALARHCLKRLADGASNIDVARSHLNRVLVGDERGLLQSLENFYASGVAKPAKQSEAPYLRIVLSASPDYFRPKAPEAAGTWDEDRLARWREATMSQLRTEYGEDLVFADLHLDEDTPHIHAVVAPTYVKKPRMPGRQKRGETPAEFEARKRAAAESTGVRTVGRSSHATLSKKNSFGRLRESMAVAVHHLGIEYGEDRAFDAPEGQSTREWVKKQAELLRRQEVELEAQRKKIEELQQFVDEDYAIAEQARQIADEYWDQASEAMDAQKAAEARREAAEAEATQIRETALKEAQERAEALLAKAEDEGAAKALQITQEVFRKLEKTLLDKGQQALLTAERQRDQAAGAFSLLKAILREMAPDLFEKVAVRWNEVWKTHPNNPDRKPEAPSQSYSGPQP